MEHRVNLQEMSAEEKDFYFEAFDEFYQELTELAEELLEIEW